MANIFEFHGAIYDKPTKGHDRLFIDSNDLVAGVFDGAGGDELSKIVIQELPGILEYNTLARRTSAGVFMARVLAGLDNLPEAIERKSTASIACIDEKGSEVHITYGNIGDSSMYFYNQDTDSIDLIAHTPTTYGEVDGREYIDVSEFLGNFREEDEISAFVGSLVLPAATGWSIMGFSDGVQDDDGSGITTPKLKEILQTRAPSEVPGAILDAVEKYDDASVFVISHPSSN